MKIQNINGQTIFEDTGTTVTETVVNAAKIRANLSGANLSRANLSDANLSRLYLGMTIQTLLFILIQELQLLQILLGQDHLLLN